MKRIFGRFVVLLFLFLMAGCSNSYLVEDTTPSGIRNLQALNYLAKGSVVKIQMKDGFLLSVSYLHCTRDSLTFTETFSDLKRTVPVSDIDAVIIRSVGSGIASGMLSSVISFFGSAGVIALIASSANGPGPLYLMAIVSPVAALTGFIVGYSAGSERVYKFPGSNNN